MQGFEIIPDLEPDVFPVVQARSFEVLAVQREPQRFDQVQTGSGGHAGAADVTGVPGDFRSNQHNVALG